MKSTFLILILITFSCKKETEIQNETWNKRINEYEINKEQIDLKKVVKQDTIYKLLEKSTEIDTLEFSNKVPFLFIKTGKIFSETTKNAILVSCPTDKTYKIELYTLINKKWSKSDEIDKLEVQLSQYEILFKDYNFDNFADIYLNATSSQGISLSRGNLLIVNSLTKKLEKHTETRNLANIFPDKKTKTIFVDSIAYEKDGKRIWNLIYKWENGKLKNTKRKIRNEETY
ncbi:XAC2610-related protein [Flavobacterium sp.]|uniref:XAC2610-related protein n=1 Tax=Flavobacterium sp. TaxID=239 RepID=UPI0037516C61